MTLIKVDPGQADLQPMPQGDSESARKGDRVVCLSRFPESGILLTSTGAILSTKGGTTSVVTYNDDGSETLFTGAEFRVCDMVASSPTKSPRGGALVDSTGHLIGVMGPWYRLPDEPATVPPPSQAPAPPWPEMSTV